MPTPPRAVPLRPLVSALLLGAAAASNAQPDDPISAGPPRVLAPVASHLSAPLESLPVLAPPPDGPPVVVPRNRGGHFSQGSPGRRPADPLAGPSLGPPPPVTIETFEGMGRASGGDFYVPPDVIGDVGPNHYVQMVNGGAAVYSREGEIVAGPVRLSTLWEGTPGGCNGDFGDPVVVYDELAGRWLLAQFAAGNGLCAAVSRTGNPLGRYWLYEFRLDHFPDYPKFGVWPNGYYVGVNANGATAYALDRVAMLDGDSTALVAFNLNYNYFLPADVDGTTPPPDGAPGLFYTFMDDEFWTGAPGPDRLELWALDVDWDAPGDATFELLQALPTAPFNYTVCGWFNFDCARQPDTGQRLDVVSEWPMWRAAYRNFGMHETLVGSFAVDASGTGQGGVRWFELRGTDGTWALRQEGTLAPDADSRFMPSAAMNADGVIAIGYAVSSTETYPSLRVAVRLAGDPLGQLRDEVSFHEGAGSQTGLNRYGDYFALSVDPTDDRTFWFTGEYYPATSPSEWATRIGYISVDSLTVAAERPADGAPARLRLEGPSPNPLRAAMAQFTVALDRPQRVRVDLVGVLGQRLATLHDGPLAAGERRFTLDASGLAAGVYLLRVRGENTALTRRILVAR